MEQQDKKDFSSQEVLLCRQICKLLLRETFNYSYIRWGFEEDVNKDEYYDVKDVDNAKPFCVAVEPFTSIHSFNRVYLIELFFHCDEPDYIRSVRMVDKWRSVVQDTAENELKKLSLDDYAVLPNLERKKDVTRSIGYFMYDDGRIINNLEDAPPANLQEAKHNSMEKFAKFFIGKEFKMNFDLRSSPKSHLTAEFEFGEIVQREIPFLVIKSINTQLHIPSRNENREASPAIIQLMFAKFFKQYDNYFGTSLTLGVKTNDAVLFCHHNKCTDIKELPIENLQEASSEKNRLIKLQSLLNKTHHMEVSNGKFCNFKVDYMNLSTMYWMGEPRETLRFVIQIVDGWIPLHSSVSYTGFEKPYSCLEIDDWLRHEFNDADARKLPILNKLASEYLKSITHILGFDYVHIDKYKFLDENNSK
jgi:hypothetical protein